MKKALSLLLIVGLITAAFMAPAVAGKKKKKKKPPPQPVRIERVVEVPYETPALGHSEALIGCLLIADGLGCTHATPGDGEKYVKIEIKDASGQTPYGAMAQDLDGDGIGDTDYPNFCGSTPEPVLIEEGYEVNVWINAGPGIQTPCAGIGTQGTVVYTFSNLP